MVRHNTDKQGTAFTVSIDEVSTHTGISAQERSQTVLAMLDERKTAEDFRRPGHIFPLIARAGGVLRRAGHTEAAVDLARLAGSVPAGVICEIMNEDGSMARLPQLVEIARRFDLKLITIADLIAYRMRTESHVRKEIEVSLPTSYGDFRIAAYTNELDGKEHVALIKGEIDSAKPVLVRVHSECLTGDIFGSHRCDCGPQLHAALEQIEAAGSGILCTCARKAAASGLLTSCAPTSCRRKGWIRWRRTKSSDSPPICAITASGRKFSATWACKNAAFDQ